MDTVEDCPKSPIREHLMIVDTEDRRFHICKWCGNTFIRKDEDYLKDIGPMDKMKGGDNE